MADDAGSSVSLSKEIEALRAAYDSMVRAKETFRAEAHRNAARAETAERERDEARAALKAAEPYLDAIVCYASSINEHHGNEVAKLVRAVIKQGNAN